jgi:glycosyltransferase involved in cell wall biosynthesis
MNSRQSASVVSVVIPVYKSSETLQELVQRLHKVFGSSDRPFELVLVDDASPDDTWSILIRLKLQYSKTLKIARLMKNSGQHSAILCGFSLAEGDVIVTMDDDLQNPPEEIPKLLGAIDAGYDLAIGAYESKQHSAMRNVSGGLIDRVLRSIFGLPRDFQLTSFRAARSCVVHSVKEMGGAYPYVTAMLLSQASRYTNVPLRHDPRKHGVSNYNLKRSASLAANLLLSYSAVPIWMVGSLCLSAFLFSIVFGGWVALQALVEGSSVQGWASTIVVLSFFNALVLLCLFVFSIYLSRMNQQLTRSKTRFTIAELRDV